MTVQHFVGDKDYWLASHSFRQWETIHESTWGTYRIIIRRAKTGGAMWWVLSPGPLLRGIKSGHVAPSTDAAMDRAVAWAVNNSGRAPIRRRSSTVTP